MVCVDPFPLLATSTTNPCSSLSVVQGDARFVATTKGARILLSLKSASEELQPVLEEAKEFKLLSMKVALQNKYMWNCRCLSNTSIYPRLSYLVQPNLPCQHNCVPGNNAFEPTEGFNCQGVSCMQLLATHGICSVPHIISINLQQ